MNNKSCELNPSSAERPGGDEPLSAGIVHDIAARKEADESLRRRIAELERQVERRTRELAASDEANRAKSRFLAGMSHELRTPLNGVIGMTELLMGTHLDSRQREFVKACRTSGESLLRIINDILDFSKIEAGRLELDVHEFDLENLIADTVDVLAYKAREKGLELICHVHPRAGLRVRADSTRLRQVLVNLIDNATKFTETGEILLDVAPVQLGPDAATLCFRVQDTGIGIPADRLDRLFTSFSQVDSSTTRRFGGTGLGLAISKSLVERMGGRIEVDSTEGEGTTFSFTLALSIVPRVSEDLPPAAGSLRGRRVLIVDDNETSRKVLASHVVSWGMIADWCAGVDEAMDRIGRKEAAGQPFALVLTDLAMPGRDGIDLAKALAGRADLPVLLLASADAKIRSDDLSQLGIKGRVRKSVARSELLGAILEALGVPDDPPRAVEPAEPREPALGVVQTGRVLLAEDNPINALYVTELLGKLGFACDRVVNGREAVCLVQEHRYNLVLMDCQMPEMDGLEATSRIRQLEAEGRLEPRLPIVALTASAVKGDRQRCLDAGMDDYLTTPIEAKTLTAAIQRYLPGRPGDCPRSPAAGPARPDPDDLPIRADALLARCVGDIRFAESLLDELEANGRRRVEEILSRVEKSELPAAAQAAHTLKGAAGTLCADPLHRLAAEVEAAGRGNAVELIAELADQLAREMRRCLESMPRVRERIRMAEYGNP